MELLGLLFLVALWDVTRHAVSNIGSEYKRSRGKAVKAGRKAAGGELPSSSERKIKRHHARGWWAGEVSKGFPALRTGWHTGWLAHRTATEHRKAAREEARTTHLETKASVLGGIREHRKRQAEAQGQIEAILADDPAPAGKVRQRVRRAGDEVARKRAQRQEEAARPSRQADGQPEPGPYAVRDDATPDDSDHLRPGDTRCKDCGGTGRNKAGDDACPICRGWGSEADDPDSPLAPDGTICAACGNPGTEDDPVLDAGSSPVHRSHVIAQQQAYAGRRAANANTNGSRNGEEVAVHDCWPRTNGSASPSPATTTGGNGMATASDVTYHSVIAAAQAAVGQSDQDTSEIKSRMDEAYALADEMTAAKVDPAVIDEQMAYADSLKTAHDALTDAGEHATSTSGLVERYHGQMQEAHDDAPGQVAERSFHGDS